MMHRPLPGSSFPAHHDHISPKEIYTAPGALGGKGRRVVHRADVIHEQKANSGHRVLAGEQKWDGEPSHPPRGSAVVVTRSTGNALQDPVPTLLDQSKQINPGLIWTVTDTGVGWDHLRQELLSPLLPRTSFSRKAQQSMPLPRGQTQQQPRAGAGYAAGSSRAEALGALWSHSHSLLSCGVLQNALQLPAAPARGSSR